MGVSYSIRCVSCYEKLENIEGEDDWGDDEYDVAWEELYEKLDPEFYLPWGTISAKSLLKWVNEHKEHGKIEFTAE